MNKLKQKTFTTFGIFAILSSVVLVVWVLGLYQISNMRDSYFDLSKKLEQLEKEGENSQNIKTLLRRTEKEREKLDSFFVTEETVVDFLSDIENVGNISGARVELLSFQEEGEGLVLNLESSGHFDSVFGFTKLIELLPYKLHIRNINMKYLGEVNDGEVLLKSQWRSSYVVALESFLSE